MSERWKSYRHLLETGELWMVRLPQESESILENRLGPGLYHRVAQLEPGPVFSYLTDENRQVRAEIGTDFSSVLLPGDRVITEDLAVVSRREGGESQWRRHGYRLQKGLAVCGYLCCHFSERDGTSRAFSPGSPRLSSYFSMTSGLSFHFSRVGQEPYWDYDWVITPDGGVLGEAVTVYNGPDFGQVEYQAGPDGIFRHRIGVLQGPDMAKEFARDDLILALDIMEAEVKPPFMT